MFCCDTQTPPEPGIVASTTFQVTFLVEKIPLLDSSIPCNDSTIFCLVLWKAFYEAAAPFIGPLSAADSGSREKSLTPYLVPICLVIPWKVTVKSINFSGRSRLGGEGRGRIRPMKGAISLLISPSSDKRRNSCISARKWEVKNLSGVSLKDPL